MTDLEDEDKILDPVMEEGLAWVRLMTSGRSTEQDRQALAVWRAQSPAHANALRELVRLRRLGQRKFLSKEGEILSFPDKLPSRRPGMSRRALIAGGGAIAAVGAGLMVMQPPQGVWPSLAEMTADFRTRTGERRAISVDAALAVDMNTQTSLSRIREGDRGLRLISGEAAFNTHFPNTSPFTLDAAFGRVIAAEAVFVAHRRAKDLLVTCLSGEAFVEFEGKRTALPAGRQISGGEGGISAVTPVDLDTAAAWRRGRLIFHATPLVQVIEEINRYRPGKIILTNVALAQLSVDGNFHLNRINDALGQILLLTGASATNLPGGIALIS